MPRHLTPSQIDSALGREKSVEQFLGATGEGRVSWLEIMPVDGQFQLWRFDVFDDGSDDFLDLYSFSPADGDWPLAPASLHDTVAEALRTAECSHAANPNRWVNQFVIQDEYRDYLPSRS